MVGNTGRINTGNPELNAAISIQTQQFIKGQLDNLENNISNFKWLLISIFLGTIVSILLSFNFYLKMIAISIFVLSSVLFLIIYFNKTKKYHQEKKELKKNQEECLCILYLQGKIPDAKVIEYVRLNAISRERYALLLEERKELINSVSPPIIPAYDKVKIIYRDGHEEILEKAFVNQDSKQIYLFNDKNQFSGIIFFNQDMERIISI